jgi:hypothetical protein
VLGASVLGAADVHARYRALVRRWRAAGRPEMHWASVDIVKSFDSIPHGKLLEVAETLLEEDDYWIRRYAQVSFHSLVSLPPLLQASTCAAGVNLWRQLVLRVNLWRQLVLRDCCQ